MYYDWGVVRIIDSFTGNETLDRAFQHWLELEALPSPEEMYARQRLLDSIETAQELSCLLDRVVKYSHMPLEDDLRRLAAQWNVSLPEK